MVIVLVMAVVVDMDVEGFRAAASGIPQSAVHPGSGAMTAPQQ